MDENTTNDWKDSLQYLSSLENLIHIPKVDHKYFNILVTSEYKLEYDDLLEKNLQVVVKLVKKFVTDASLCVDFCRVLFTIASCKWLNEIDEFVISGEPNRKIMPFFNEFNEHHESLLYLGAMAFVTEAQRDTISDEVLEAVDSKSLRKIERLLLNVENVDVVVCWADLWITFMLKYRPEGCELKKHVYINILKSLFSVIIAYWNHSLVHRSRIDPIVSKCLKFEFDRLQNAKSIKDLMIFQYMMDISWKVPFKYFVCRHLLSFAVSQDLLSEAIDVMKEELYEAFAKSLRNKNVVGVEMELFTFCLNNFPYEEWKNIVFPVTTFALQDPHRSDYFARWWLPQILRKFPIFIELMDKGIFKNKHLRSKVLVASLKTCYLRKIPLDVINRDETCLINYLKSLFCLREDIRGDVFSLLCELNDQSVLHSELELDTIFSFLKYNVNGNCTLLRQMMLSSFSKFILRLICSCVRVIKKQKTDVKSKINHVMVFLLDLNDFIADGMQPGCSYQRKISSLNLFKIIMTYARHECESSIHRNNLKDAGKLVDFARKLGSWRFDSDKNRKLLFDCLMDSCDEVQHLAAVLLRNYFLLDRVPETIFEDAIRVSNDNKFYKRSSGYRAVVSCIAMAYKSFEDPCQRFGVGGSFRLYFLELLKKKIEITEKDILNAAVNFPWDADVRILNFLINNPQSKEFEQVTSAEVDRLIELLERIVPVLLKALFVDKSADYAPSFEESDLALRMLIKNSVISESFRGDEEQEQCQLQPLNQLLLNFIWITLKVCSNLESTLVVNRTNSMTKTQVIRCCNLIATKLKLCRHKGLIEAAGVSLSSIVRCLTSQNLYGEWFESVVSEILYMIEFKSGATISRKSAGLSILIQNIIGNDRRLDKPLIGKCWKEFKRILNVDYDLLNVGDVCEELPQTHALHLLKVIVADSRNSVDLLPYLEEITTICLTTLKAPLWVIRNAALQLFGVLLLKIVGQRNPTPTIGVRFSFEEVFFTMPRILDHLILTLEQATNEFGEPIPHSDVAPVLVILASLKLTSIIILDDSIHQKVRKSRWLIEKLLISDLYAVRELAAKALVNLHSPKEMLSQTTNLANNVIEYIKFKKILQGENHVHGCLFLLKQIYDMYPESRNVIKENRVNLTESLNVSLVSQTLLFDVNMVNVDVSLNDFLNHVENVMNIVESKRYLSIGYEQWLFVVLRVLLKNHEPCLVLEKCLKLGHRGILITVLDLLLEFEVNEKIFPILLECLDRYIEKKDNDVMNRIMTTFTELHKPNLKISFHEELFQKCFDVLKELNYYHFQGVNVHLLGILVANSGHRINDVLQNTHECLDITKYNKNIRLNAALSMLNLSSVSTRSDISMKLVWTIVVDLVQDEEADIRSIGSACFTNIFNIDEDFGPEVAMNELFNINLIGKLLNTNAFIDLLWNKLKISSFQRDEVLDEEELNPFDQGIINCYAEEVKIVKLAGDTLTEFVQRDLSTCKEYFSGPSIKEYFNSHIGDIMNNYQRFSSEYLVNAENYLITLKCYYVLFVFQNVKGRVDNEVNECTEILKKVLHF